MPEGNSLYLSLEEKYYSIVGRLGPIRGIVERIDRFFPSFLLLIIIVLAIAAFFLVPLLLESTSTELRLRLVNAQGTAIQGSVQLSFAGKTETLQTNNAGIVAKALLPKDSSVEFFAVAKGYSSLKDTVFVGSDRVSLDLVLQAKNKTFDRKIIFALESGERIKGKIILARLACANAAVKPGQENISSDKMGELEFIEPENCGTLTLTVTGPAEFRQKSVSITDALTVVALEFEGFEKGIIDLKLIDESSALLESMNASVSLVKNGSLAQTFQTGHGHGLLEALPAHYELLVQDNALQYAMIEKIEFDLNEGQKIIIEARMSNNIKGFVIGMVVDLNNGSAIENANVELRDLMGSLLASAKTNEKGEFKLPVIRALFLFLSVSAEGYLPFEESVELSAGTKTIALEKANESNSGKIRVFVFDPDNAGTANAVVSLHYADSLALAPYEEKITDENGLAEFYGVKSGKYVVFAEKYPYSAQSTEQETKITQAAEFFLWFNANTASILLKAVDEKGKDISGTTVSVFNAADDGNKIDTVELQNGNAFYSTRADKRVYFVFLNPEYLPYYTESFNLFQIDFITVRARMLKQISGDAPKAELKGIFNEFNERIVDLESGKDYTARIELLVPEGKAFDVAGLHFRVGSEKSVEEDELQIVAANTGIASVFSGKTFNEPKSEQTDLALENTNVLPAKWIEATIEKPQAGVFAVALKLRVNEKARLNSLLPMFYRAWGNENRAFYRFPGDSELGQAREIAEKQELYAKTVIVQQYFKRAERACYGTLCIVVNVQNAESTEFLEEPFELFKGADYNVFFTIINSGNNALENFSLSISNSSGGKQKSDLKISSFEIESQKQAFSDYSTGVVETSTIEPEKSVSGMLSISPQKESYAALQFRTSANDMNNFVFTIYFDAFEKRFMKIIALPEKPVALAESKIKFFATDQENDGGVSGVLFKLSLLGADYSESYLQKKADSNGTVEFFLPAMKPGSVLIAEAFSAKFFSKPMELEFGNAPLYFSPTRAIVLINTKESLEKKETFKIVNAISKNVNVESVELLLEQPAFFDESAMKEFLKEFPREFTAFSEKETELLLVKIKNNVFIPKNSRFKGVLLVKAKSDGIEWVFALPFEVLVDANNQFSGNNACIGLQEGEWNAEMQKNLFYKNIELKNNCKIGEDAINIYDLHANAEWDSEAMGNLEVALLDAAGKEIVVVPALGENSPAFLQELKVNAKAKIVLRFVPKNGYWGKTAGFSARFSAISPNKESNAEIISNNIVGGNILLFNPISCVRLVPHPSKKLGIGENDRNNSFEVDASLCGDARIEFSLCEGNADCSSGTEGGIFVSPSFFVTTKTNPKKTINVIRSEIPGEYGINISARVKDVVFKKFVEMLVEIQPEKREQIFLDKYSFYLNGDNSMDSATITNKKLSEIVKVEASVCDWRGILEKNEWHFNFGDAGGGLRAAELSGSSELFNKAMATSSAMAQVDSNSIIVAVEAVRLAYEKAKKAAIDAKKADDAAQKATQEAQKLAQIAMLIKIAINVTETATQTKIEAVCGKQSATARSKLLVAGLESTALNVAVGQIQTDVQSMQEKISSGSSSMGSSLSKTEMMKENSEDGKKQLQPEDSSEISFANRLAAGDFNRARENGKEAATKNKDGESKLDKAQSMAGTVIQQGLTKGIAQVAVVETTNYLYLGVLETVSVPPCCANPEYCPCSACTAAVQSAVNFANAQVATDIANITAQFQATQTAIENAQSLALEAIISAAEAREAEIDAVIKLRRAVSVAQSLSEASFKTGEAQSADSNVVNKIVSLYPFIGFIWGEFESGIYFELEKPCNYKIKGSVIDYITDLRNDIEPLQLDVEGVSAFVNKQEAKTFGDYNLQTIGIVFQNNGFESKKPVYGTMTISYKKHLHDFIQEVPLGYKEFGPFRVPDSSAETMEQKFHVRIVPKPQEQVVLPEQQSENCLQGIKNGSTGKNALPRIKLNWSWDEEKGIAQNTCDETNPNYSYCDAAQFNILLSKKLNFLDEWLSANNGRLQCPQNTVEKHARTVIEKLSSRIPETNSIGIEKIAANVKGNDVSIIVSVKNDSSEEKTANLVFSLIAPKDVSLSEDESTCLKSQAVPAGVTIGVDCKFEGLSDSKKFYSAKSYLQPNDSYALLADSVEFNDEQNIDLNSSLSVAFKTSEDTAETTCWLQKTTDLFDGKSALEYFARDSNPKWTANVKNLGELAKLLRFNAFLTEDNYNESFAKDFADYYSNTRFFDTPTFFSDAKIGRTMNKYYSSGKILFNNKYFDSTKLQGAGLFAIDINSDFGEKWELFSAQQEPRAVIKPIFSKIAEPFPSSPFYYLPFDSEIGVKNKSLERDNYGTAYEVQGQVIGFNETEFDRMPESADAKALKKVSTIFDQNLETINASALSRGNILSVLLANDANESAQIIFSPSYASPAIIRVSAEKQSAFALAVYQLLKSGQALDAGNSLSYWSGMDNCYDFSGKLAKEKFDYSPDRKASVRDRSSEWKKSYALDLGAASKTGNLFLKAIVFTPLDGSFNLKAISPNLKIAGLDKLFGETKELKGITGMRFNNKESGNYIKTLKDAFAAVENASACISSNGIETSIWWNATAIEKQLENGKSIETIEKALEPGKDCLGK